MANVRRLDTKPEIEVRKALFAAGFRFRAPCEVPAGRS